MPGLLQFSVPHHNLMKLIIGQHQIDHFHKLNESASFQSTNYFNHLDFLYYDFPTFERDSISQFADTKYLTIST